MLYPYVELPNETIITHSEIKEDQSILIHFEQPYDDGFREARIQLPSYKWLYNDGFSEKQIKSFIDFAHENVETVYKHAKEIGANKG